MNLIEVTKMTQSELVAGMVSGEFKHDVDSMVRTVSQRVPITTLARVEAMSAKAKKSRNAMINLLLEAGLDAVSERLDTSVKKSVSASANRLVKTMVKNAEALSE